MYKSFFVFVFVLYVFPSDPVLGQAAPPQKQRQTNVTYQTDRTTVTSASFEPNPEAKSLYDEGVKRVEMGEVSEAVERFQRAVKLDPDYADAYSALGRAFFKLRQWDNASGNLRHAIALRAARERERQEVLQKNRTRRINTDIGPTGPGTKPEQTNGNNVRTPGLVSLTILRPEPRKNAASISASPTHVQTRATQQGNANARPATLNSAPQTPLPRAVPNVNAKPQDLKNNESPRATLVSAPVKMAATQPDRVQTDQQQKAVGTVKSAAAIANSTLRQSTNIPSLPVELFRADPKRLLPPEQQQKATATVKSAAAIISSTLQATSAQAPPVELFRSEQNRTQQPDAPTPQLNSDAIAAPKQKAGELPLPMNVTPSSATVETKSVVSALSTPSTAKAPLTNTYHVGPGDVLDVRLSNSQSQQTTAFAVTQSGLLEHPNLSQPLAVRGLTVEEIGAKIENDLKQRGTIDNPKVFIGVLDYASHAIVVSGLVKDPGTKFLKHEAVPLVVVLADAQPKPEAGRVTVVRNGRDQILETDLNRTSDMNFLVRPGDIVTLQPNVTQSFFIDGKVKFPGEKTYRIGLTLMQAVITAGGATSKANVAEISRDDGQGSVVRTRFDLSDIESGNAADPVLRPGDRITILH